MSTLDFDAVRKVSDNLKRCLEDNFGHKYVVIKKISTTDAASSNAEKIDILQYFHIKISHQYNPIYTTIKSADDLSEVKKSILKSYRDLVDDFNDVFDKVESQLDSNTIESLDIIRKSLSNREKKMTSAFNKFKNEDSWDVSKIQKEFSNLLIKLFKDILQEITGSVYSGIKFNTVYEDIIKLINSFFQKYGVYTKEYKVGSKLDDDAYSHVNTMSTENDETQDIRKKDIIKEIHSLPYLFDNETTILEGLVTVWKVS